MPPTPTSPLAIDRSTSFTTSRVPSLRCRALLATTLVLAGCEAPVRRASVPVADGPLPPLASLPIESLGDDIGTAAKGDSSAIGTILGGVVLRDGAILVLEQGTNTWFRFDTAGVFVGKRNAKGGGPGEFWEPHGLVVGRQDTIVVSDPSSRRISLLLADQSGFPRLVRSFAINGAPSDICVTNEAIVAVGAGQDHLLSVYDWTGRLVGEVAKPLGDSADTPMMRESKSISVIACAPDGKSVFVASRMSPEVVRLELPTGRVLWKRVLAGSPGIDWRSDAPGALTLRSPLGGYDRRLGLVVWSPESLIVTMARVTWDKVNRVQDFRPHLRLLDTRTGVEVGRVPDAPALRLLDRVRGRVFSFEELPEPRVRRFQLLPYPGRNP